MQAGGTIAPGGTGTLRRAWLLTELTLIFLAAPLVMHHVVHGEGVPLFLALFSVLMIALAILTADPSFQLVKELRRGFGWQAVTSIGAIFAVAGGATALWVQTTHPQWFLEFPRNRPELYQRIMLLYPLMSVAAQEFVYRTFYFHRYGPLFGPQRWLGIVVNGLLFGFAHIVVGTAFAIIATFVGGMLFALRYAATRSYWAVFVEHTLWGWLVFTVGLGRYFFTGVANP